MDNTELIPLVLNPSPNITRVVDNESEEKLIEFLERTFDFGFDVETTVVKDFYYRRMRTMQFGTSNEQYVIDLKAYCDTLPELLASDLLYNCQGQYGKNLWMAPRLQKLFERLKKYLCSDKWVKTGVNLAFEYECLYWQFGIRAYGWYDCMWTEKCIYAGLGGSSYLKNYDFYSMEEMFGRYFGKSIDKTLQTSFNLEDDLSNAQFEYAALDTRTPIAIKGVQKLIATGMTPAKLRKQGKPIQASYLERVDRLVLGDDLTEVIDIENGCLGSFVDMHVHGERLDCEKWLARVTKKKERKVEVIKQLDGFFLPWVGSKNEIIKDEDILKLENEWKTYNNPWPQELDLKLKLITLRKEYRKLDLLSDESMANRLNQTEIEIQMSQIEQQRKSEKEALKKKCSDLKKKRTAINKLAADCEGEALINYSSDAQLKHCLKANVKRLEKIEALDDDVLEKYESIPVIKLIREYHGLAKEIGTYGDAWAQVWVTHPCKEEGWRHPGDGRLHSEFNQYDAETGRSSSEKPNGQNIPGDKEVRSCFIADPPNKEIRISNCCGADTEEHVTIIDGETFKCYTCTSCSGDDCATHAEEYIIVTADMSGAELRIIAEDANDPVWINAFAKGEDVHSVGTELLYEVEWPAEALRSILKPDGWTLEDCKTEVVLTVIDNGKVKEIGPCAYYALKPNGEFAKKKCNCPKHVERRGENKSANFLLVYGGGPGKLAIEIGKTVKVARELMALHEKKNPRIWAYLDKSGKDAQMNFKAFDLFGRRRILPEPTYERAKENCKERNEKILRLDSAEAEHNIQVFEQVKGRKPNQSEEYTLTHREPTPQEIGNSFYGMSGSINRQGKNHRIQGTNATIAKLAMSALFDKDGKPYLWHILPLFRAKLIKFVHDELVVQYPKQYGQKVAEAIGDAFKRAAATHMHKVVMEFDFNIAPFWKK
jgi:DNA polymerase I-like protein with 3'-5' exonuclease and polymerase domains